MTTPKLLSDAELGSLRDWIEHHHTIADAPIGVGMAYKLILHTAALSSALAKANGERDDARAALEKNDLAKRLVIVTEQRDYWIARLAKANGERDDARAALAKTCAALGFGDLRRVESSSGVVTVQVTSDAYLNLMGALDDLTNSNGNDAITRKTIDRVIGQLAAAKAVLHPNSEGQGNG